MSTILMCLGLIAFKAGPEVDAVRFRQLMQGLHSPIHDVTFAFEGGVRSGEGARAAGLDIQVAGQDYQGRYSYRSDGAAFLDFYKRGLKDDDRQSHSLLHNLEGFASVTVVPDRKHLSTRPPRNKSKSSRHLRPSSLSRPGCPDRILYEWYFQALTDLQSMHYEFQGWEGVDGQECLRVELDSEATSRSKIRDRFRMWIDMSHGGHPLKVDYLREGEVIARADKIKLQQFLDSKGILVWLPSSGQFESFRWTSLQDPKEIVNHAAPVLVETYAVVTGSVVLNQDLSDADLTIGANVTKCGEFRDFKGFKKERSRAVRTDPKGVRKRLDEALADADSKAAQLEASASVQTIWSWSTLLPLGLPVLGTALLAWAGARKWMGR